MVQLAGSPRKRQAAAAAAAAAENVPPLAGGVKVEMGEGFGGGNVPVLKRVRAAQQPLPTPQDTYSDVLDGPSPLGLRLRKSPSLLDLIQTSLSKAKSAPGQSATGNSISGPPIKKESRTGALAAGERLKASNFPATFLKIGAWEYTSEYEGDLVAKCYYAKHKIVWEVMDCGLKSKIEIQWAHISALKATCPEEGYGTLDLVVSEPPIFFKETDPQPRKHTIWQAASDFTGGQASMHRRHILQCSPSLLSRHFEKLVQCDKRLNQLSQQPDIILDSLFEPTSSIFENPNECEAPSSKFTPLGSPCAVSSVSKTYGVNHLMLEQPEFFSQPVTLDVPTNVVAEELENPNWCNLATPGLRSSMDGLLNHLGNCITEQQAAGNPPLPNTEAPSKEFLDIAQCLLSDTQGPPSSDEKYLMARVDSLYSLLEKDTAPSTISMPDQNGDIAVGEMSFEEELRSCLEDKELGPAPATKTADVTEPAALSRKDSFEELLENLPRIASISQYLFDIEEDSENSGSRS